MVTLNNYNKKSPIAFFDSGVGGLTVLDKVKKLLPNESFIYYGDTKHMPYGEKNKEQLMEYSKNIFEFFEKKGAKAVVMACNTTSSMIYEDVKNSYGFKIFSIVQSVSEILAHLQIKKLGIFGTKATINSCAYQKEIAKYNSEMEVFGQYCSNWVHIVEENSITDEKNIEIIKQDLDKMLLNNPEKIVLGCTHYPFLLEVLAKFVSKDLFIDPAVDFANKIKFELEKNNLLNDSDNFQIEEFYVSSNPEGFKNSAKMFYDLKNLPKLLEF